MGGTSVSTLGLLKKPLKKPRTLPNEQAAELELIGQEQSEETERRFQAELAKLPEHLRAKFEGQLRAKLNPARARVGKERRLAAGVTSQRSLIDRLSTLRLRSFGLLQ